MEIRGHTEIRQNGAPSLQNPIHGIERSSLAAAFKAPSLPMNPVHGIERKTSSSLSVNLNSKHGI